MNDELMFPPELTEQEIAGLQYPMDIFDAMGDGKIRSKSLVIKAMARYYDIQASRQRESLNNEGEINMLDYYMVGEEGAKKGILVSRVPMIDAHDHYAEMEKVYQGLLETASEDDKGLLVKAIRKGREQAHERWVGLAGLLDNDEIWT